jgi:uncharacterized protein
MTQAEAYQLLATGEYGILSSCGPDGDPYGVPLSYCVLNDAIYFHCAVSGRKLDNLASRSAVSFCVVGKTELLPRQFSTRYQSVIVAGCAAEVFDLEKQQALEALVAKYSPDHRAEGLSLIAAENARTRLFRIGIDTICGKARR